jgi:hypothetical protein
MILFKSDWNDYPTAMIHRNTRNKSFVRIAQLYKHMGIKNHLFPLALINPELEFVDPHDEDLSDEMKGKIILECKINPWYFFREVARAPVKGSRTGSPIRANRGNMALWWSFFNHIYIFLIQPRQTGKSMSTDALMEYLLLIQCMNTTISLTTAYNKLRVENVARIRNMMGLLPPWMYLKGPKDRENLEEITVTLLKNHYITSVAQASEKDAHNSGRGLTQAIAQFDESPFQTHIETAMKAAIPAMGAAIDSARENGTPYGIIHTTTAGKKDDRDGKYIYSLLEKSAPWSEHFFDAPNEKELEVLVRANSRGNVFRINATFSHRQLGFSDEWLAEKLERADQEGESADRDYFNIWTSGSETLPFSIEIAEAIRRSQRDVEFPDISKEGYILRWYIPESQVEQRMKSSKFFIGMDPSDAGGNDDISFVLVDIYTGDVVAAGTYNTINLNKFTTWVGNFMIKYENTIFCPENRSQGQSIIDGILAMFSAAGIDPFKRIFNWVVNNQQEYPDRFQEIKSTPPFRRTDSFYAHYKKQFGFATSGSGTTSRTELYGTTLRRALTLTCTKIHDRMLIEQFLGLVTKNGRIDHADGSHDDMVIGWLMCMYVLIHGKNLGYYGIDTNRILSQAKEVKEMSPMDHIQQIEQQQHRNRMAELEDLLVREADEFMAMKWEQELRMISRKIEWGDDEFHSIEQMLLNIKEKKKKSSASRRLERNVIDNRGTGYNPYAIVQNGFGSVVSHGNYRRY